MTVHYFTHCHGPSLAHVKCLLSSLRQHEPKPKITVVVDDAIGGHQAAQLMTEFLLENVTSMSVVECECRELGICWGKAFSGRDERTRAWAMQACLPYWMMNRVCDDLVVYQDSDVFNFSPFQSVIDAFPETAHVGVCRHFYPPGKENMSAGAFNNGTAIFRNSNISRDHCLLWAKETLERWQPGHPREIPHEQRLLDEWPGQLGTALWELPPECDWGPWRLDGISGDPPILLATGKPLQSAHFHEFRRGLGKNPIVLAGQQWNESGYDLHPSTAASIYRVYAEALEHYL